MDFVIPTWLEDSIKQFEKLKNTTLWDCGYCELQSDINVAEVEGLITSDQAWFLREKYLDLDRNGR